MARSREKINMNCPKCGKEVSGVGILVGSVRVGTFVCSDCGRHWRSLTFTSPLTVHDMVSELEALLKRFPISRPEYVSRAIDFLQLQIDKIKKDKAGPKTLRERRADLWEKQFLKAALGEDF